MSNAVGVLGRACIVSGLLLAPVQSAQAQLSAPVATLTRELRIDGAKEDFSAVSGVAVNARGDIALGFGQDGQLRIYDANGKRLATAGRRGGGPGEFRRVNVRGWIGDTVWVFDHELKRHSFVSREGKFIRSIPLERAVNIPLGGDVNASPASDSSKVKLIASFTPHTRGADGGMLGLATVSLPDRPGVRVNALAIVSYAPNGALRVVATRREMMSRRWEIPFGPWPTFGFTADGTQAGQVIVNDMKVTGATLTVQRFAANGDTLMNKTFPYRGVPMSKRYIDSVVAQGIGPDRVKSVSAERVPPIHSPTSGGMLLGPDGQTWIVLRETAELSMALLLNASGAPVAQFPLPPQTYLTRATATHVWLTESDADGLQSIVRYSIRCGTGPCK